MIFVEPPTMVAWGAAVPAPVAMITLAAPQTTLALFELNPKIMNIINQLKLKFDQINKIKQQQNKITLILI